MSNEKIKIKLSELSDMYDIEDDNENIPEKETKPEKKSIDDFDEYTVEVDEEVYEDAK